MKRLTLKNIFIILSLSILVDGCANLSKLNMSVMYKRDKYDNPCTCNFEPAECDYYKAKFPKDYAKYMERMEAYKQDSTRRIECP